MNLQCRIELAAKYKAGSQIARVLSEEWCTRELYCPACDSNRLTGSKPNNPAVDFTCAKCQQPFQLKSLSHWNPKKVVDAGYEAMLRAIRADMTPNLLILHYSHTWLVQDLLLIPKMFFSESVIEKRKPLASHARRAGWVGCNILLSEIPSDGKIVVISDGVPVLKKQVREEFSRVKQLAEVPPSLRGWTLDVLGAIRRLGKPGFSLQELYGFESELKSLHPRNQNVRPKIRQQLQVLRDVGLISFLSPGIYRLRT
ncbi:MAG TPA: DpnI domain-containing protein [Terriglobales bacterium]|jgi:type II restriction enzyme|nr:DpnI domain-containing protein [Terriglobales bacterium]